MTVDTLALLTALGRDGTWLLECDLCGNRTRLPVRHRELERYLTEWKRAHEVHHVYLAPAGYDPAVTDPFDAVPPPCDEWGRT